MQPYEKYPGASGEFSTGEEGGGECKRSGGKGRERLRM